MATNQTPLLSAAAAAAAIISASQSLQDSDAALQQDSFAGHFYAGADRANLTNRIVEKIDASDLNIAILQNPFPASTVIPYSKL